VLICSERRVLLAGCWWLICSERKVLLVADKPNEQGVGVVVLLESLHTGSGREALVRSSEQHVSLAVP
jgi:hypothetical protein